MEGKRPLSGIGVAVTRGEDGEGPLSTILKERGAKVLDWGSISFLPPEDPCPLLGSLARIRDYDWVCFSSPRAVDAVASRMREAPDGVMVAAVGPSTALALREAGWPVHRVPEEGRGEGLVAAFREAGDARGQKVLFPASDIARDVIPDGLSTLGAEVDRVTAYRTVTLSVDREACRAALESSGVGVVTFASPSAMNALRAGIGEKLFHRLVREVPAAAMGPTTAQALREAGWGRLSVAEAPTLEGLANAAEAAAHSSSDR